MGFATNSSGNKGKKVLATLVFIFMSGFCYSQLCDCPPIDECSSCSGGFISLTLQYIGAFEVVVKASDGSGTILVKGVRKGSTFVVPSSTPGQPFVGGFVELDGIFTDPILIVTTCTGSLSIGAVYGDFLVVAAESQNGLFCCAAGDTAVNPPVITGCSSDIVISLDENSCAKVIDWTEPTASDDCELSDFTSTHKPGDTFQQGTTEVVYTAIDNYGNTTTCSFNVKLRDTISPLIESCINEEIVVQADEGRCEAEVTWQAPTATDICGVTLTSNYSPGDVFPAGKTSVVYTATDVAGNISTCSFDVLVKVTNSMVISISGCPEDIVLKTDNPDPVRVDWIPPAAKGPCGDILLTSTHNPGDVFPAGTTEVRYKALDNAGNTAFCSFSITIIYEDVKINVIPVLTPDGDGNNDLWRITHIEKYKNNKVVVVDRWGSEIYRATGYNNEDIVWNGNSKNGNLAPAGTYFYFISVKFGSTVVEKRGFIELIH